MEPAVLEPETQDFEAWVRLYRPRIFRFALASLRDRDAAETITQDCFLRAYQSRAQFRGDASLQTWLLQIAVNLVRDAGRNRRLQFWKRAQATALDLTDAADWLPDAGRSPEADLDARQQIAAIWRAVADLSERQRTVFLLRFMEDMDPAEIAAATGITRAAIKVHLFRAVHAVRGKLNQESR